jgi:hypothetical protein
MEALLDSLSVRAPVINCDSGHRVEKFCSNKACPHDAACCRWEECKLCEERHQNCLSFVELRSLARNINQRFSGLTKQLRDIFRMENELVN